MSIGLAEGQNCWAVICPEPDAPGAWGTWVKEGCVALGWPPSGYHLTGKAKHSNWAQARKRVLKVKRSDIVIPYLKDHRFGIPGIVERVAVGDDEWNPTVAKGAYSRNPDEAELGRRIELKWLKNGVPPLNEIVVTPESVRGRGVVRATIERVLPKRYARFMEIIGDRRNWEKYVPGNSRLNIDDRQGGDSRESNRRRPLKKAASDLTGNKLYLKRAREAFPILVRQAQARQTIFYSDLADKLNMPNPRNLNFVLGAIGKAIQKLSDNWKQEMPPIQCLVVNKNTGMPGEGIGWFISDLKDFSKRTLEEKKQILGVELVKVFNYSKWYLVLRAFGLTPLSTDPVVKTLMNEARHMGGVGECEDHRNLKHYIANNPTVLRLSDFEVGDTEYSFPSADRIDVVFRDGNSERWVGVEVKGPSSDDADILRGLFQCVKYAALREAELKSVSKKGSTRVVLVLSKTLPQSLKVIKNLLGVEVVEGIVVPPSFVPPGDRDQITSAISK